MPGGARRQHLEPDRLGDRAREHRDDRRSVRARHDVAQSERPRRNLAAQRCLGRPRKGDRMCDGRLARQPRREPRCRSRRLAAHQGQRALVRVAEPRLQPNDGLAPNAQPQVRGRLDATTHRPERELVQVAPSSKNSGASERPAGPGRSAIGALLRPAPMVEPRPLIGAATATWPHRSRTIRSNHAAAGRTATERDSRHPRPRWTPAAGPRHAQQGIDLARVGPQRQQRRRRFARQARPLLAREHLARRCRELIRPPRAGIANASSGTRASCSQIGARGMAQSAGTPAGRRSHQRAGREQHARQRAAPSAKPQRRQPGRQAGTAHKAAAARASARRSCRRHGIAAPPSAPARAVSDATMRPACAATPMANTTMPSCAMPASATVRRRVERREQRDGTKQQRRQTECDQQPGSDAQPHEQQHRHVGQAEW